jgi:molybdopterin converting factor small subunit
MESLFTCKEVVREREYSLQVRVRFYGFVQDVAGASPHALDVPERSTLRNLLELLVERVGERLRERLFNKAGELEANVQVFIGDSQAISLEELLGDDQRFGAEVKVFVLTATAGG